MELGAFLRREQLSMKSTGRGAKGARYALVATIDRGGMGELFLAKQFSADSPPRYVVVKRILPALLEDEKYVKMFVAEADVMSRLNHPNIVRLVDRPMFDDQQCLALEYVRGRNVSQILTELGARRMEPVLVLKVMSQVLRGLEYAHQFRLPDGRPLKLVHRDVTPGNVLVSYQGEVKLADFGIAKHEMSGVLTTVGIVKGKARYLSPEQVVGDPATPRSDVFSAACVILEMLTGKPLFDAPSVPKTLYAIVNGDHPAVEALVPFHAPLLVQLLTRALAKDARRRLGSAREFAEGLEAAARLLGRPSDAKTLGMYLRQLFHEPDEIADDSDVDGPGQAEETAPSSPRVTIGGAAFTVEDESDDMRTEIAGPLAPKPLLSGDSDEDAATAARDSAYGSTVPPDAIAIGEPPPEPGRETTNPHAVDEALSVLGWLQARGSELRADAADPRDPAEDPLASGSSPSALALRALSRPRRAFVTAVFASGLALGVGATLGAQTWLDRARPGSDRPGSDRPGSDRPGSDRPGSDRLGSSTSTRPLDLGGEDERRGPEIAGDPSAGWSGEGRGPLTPAVAGAEPVMGPSPLAGPVAGERGRLEPEPLAGSQPVAGELGRLEPEPLAGSQPVAGELARLDLLEPRGATIRLDGVWLKQRVPLRDLEIPPGRHRIRIATKNARQDLIFSVDPGERIDLTRPVKRRFSAPPR